MPLLTSARPQATSEPSLLSAYHIDSTIYINDLFDSFIAPTLTDPLRLHYYRRLVHDLTLKILSDRYPLATPENTITVLIDVFKALGLYISK